MVTATAMAAEPATPAPGRAPTADDRIVALGDSITDGNTYPQILMQALREAGRPVPVVVCAGVASDTAAQMAARFEQDVLRFQPTVVTVSAGTNDAHRGVTDEAYEAALRAICERGRAAGALMVLLTPCVIEPREGADEAATQKARELDDRVLGFEKVVRRLAAEFACPVAECNRRMREARDRGVKIMAGDGIHPDYMGQSLMARAILDALACTEVALPKEFQPRLFPDVVRSWRMRLAPLGEDKKPVRLTEASAATLDPDAAWVEYRLPDAVPAGAPGADDWREQCRRNGFGLQVQAAVGKGLVQAVAFLDEAAPRKAFINTGIGVSTVWLNGRKLHEQGGRWTGYHAGKERLPVELAAGRNRLVLEVEGNDFFLSLTDTLVWETALR